MRLFAALLASLLSAWVAHLIAYHLVPGHLWIESLGNSFSPAGNLSFAIVLAFLVARNPRISLSPVAAAVALLLFIIAILGLALLGMMLADHWMFGGLLLVSPIGAIGYYPPGPDMDFVYGAKLWAVSVLLVASAGLLPGALVRWALRKPIAK